MSALDDITDLMINGIVVNERVRIDFTNNPKYPSDATTSHYYYGRIVGFRSQSYRVDMIPHHDFTPRTQFINAKCCTLINRLEELLYF